MFALVGGVPTASVVKITALANAPGRLYEFLYSLSTRWFDRRRACAPLFAMVGGVPTASVVMVTARANAPGRLCDI